MRNAAVDAEEDAGEPPGSRVRAEDIEEELIVSEWPGSCEARSVASIEMKDGDDDKDASANG